MFSRIVLISSISSTLLLSGCASGTFKARQEQREKLAASTGMYCDFVNGDVFPDVEVELSMQMARRCDSSKSFSLTNYRNSSDKPGVIYCCSTSGRVEKKASQPAKPTAPGKEENSPDPVIAE